MSHQEQIIRAGPAPAAARVSRDWPAAAVAMAVAGLCFVLYPAIRPFTDESSLAGARAFASSSWIVAHGLAMAGFILLTLGLAGLYPRLGDRRAQAGLVLTAIGAGLTLPYYGAEAFGLHALGQQAIQRQDRSLLLALTRGIRWEAGIWFIVPGLLMIGIGMILVAASAWTSPAVPRWAAIPLALGFVLYLPQFAAAQPVRVADGLLIAAGCWLLAWHLARPSGAPA